MAFCGKCGSSVAEGTAFCSRCGAPVTPAVPGSTVTSAPLTPNLAAALSYLLGFVTGIVFLVLEPYKNDKFVRFHAFQSILLCGVLFAFSLVWHIVFGILLPTLLWVMASLLLNLVYLAVFIYWLFLMYKAYQNERHMIPYIGELAARQAGL
jgi:uncharacterized membrane protein